MNRTFQVLVALAATFAAGLVHASDIGLTPPRIELVAIRGSSGSTSVTVLTTSAREQRIEVLLEDWTLGITGRLSFLPVGHSGHTANRWIRLESDSFVLEPRGSRDVRIAVDVPDDEGLEGTYHGMVFFTVAPPELDTPGAGVATTTRIGLTVYVTIAGTERAGSELVDMYQPDNRSLTTVILNTGNTLLRLGGAVEIRDEAGDVVRRLEVPDVPVLRESERELTFTLPDDLPSGFYVALALVEDSRGGILAGELPVDVP